jgi:hypothetical protein
VRSKKGLTGPTLLEMPVYPGALRFADDPPGDFWAMLPEVEITTTELAKKSRKDLGQCHPKEIEFRTRVINGFRLASSLKAMLQQSNTS